MEGKSYEFNYPSLPNKKVPIGRIIKLTPIIITHQEKTHIDIYDLPFDVLCEITNFLLPIDLSRMRKTSKEFRKLVSKLIGHCYWSVQNLIKLQRITRKKKYENFWYLNVHKICGLKTIYNIKLIKTPIHIKAGKYFPSNKYKSKNIKSGDIPPTVKILDLSMSRFNHTIEKDSLSKKLEVLIFPNRFNKSLEGVLPYYLRVLILGSNWNYGIPLIKGVPIHTNEIELDMNLFPASLEILVIKSIHFNLDITHILKSLSKLRKLVLGSGYRQKLTYIPDNLKYLEVGKYYPYSLENIPKNIIVIKNI